MPHATRPRSAARRLSPRLAAAALALGALAAAPACARPSPAERRAEQAARPTGDVVVAAAWPWGARGDFRYGEGLDLAVDEINRAGGVLGRRLRVLRVDDRESVDEGRLLAQRLADSAQVVAVIGHLQSYVTVPAAPIYDQAGLLLFAPVSTDPALTAQGLGRVFRGTFTQDAVGRQMAEYATERGFKRVGVYYVRDAYGRGLANAFEERAEQLGVRVAAREAYDPTEELSGRPFEQTLAEWKTLDLDALFVAGEVPAAGALVAEARRQGITVPVLGGDAMHADALVRVAGSAAEGAVVASMFHPDEPRPEVRRFAGAFRARYGAEPDMFSAIGYDAVHVLAAAMRRARSAAPDAVARALRDTAHYAGVTGPFRFAPNGDPVEKPVVRLQVRGGRFAYLSTAQAGGATRAVTVAAATR
jgi:branched-chain amino acid transport system substrate-binding protein